MYMYICTSLSLYIYIYIYIHTHIWGGAVRQRVRGRRGGERDLIYDPGGKEAMIEYMVKTLLLYLNSIDHVT